VTNAPKNPNADLIREIVECVRILIDTFPVGQDVPRTGSLKQLEASLKKLQEGPALHMDYLMLSFAALTIQWAAHETGRDEIEILDELVKTFSASAPHDDSRFREA
jgi:hypothetical protein